LGPLHLQLCCSPQLPPELEEARQSRFSSATQKRRQTRKLKMVSADSNKLLSSLALLRRDLAPEHCGVQVVLVSLAKVELN
jgi:hypothetical protein